MSVHHPLSLKPFSTTFTAPQASLLCICACAFKCTAWMKVSPQIKHPKGCLPQCTLRCTLRLLDCRHVRINQFFKKKLSNCMTHEPSSHNTTTKGPPTLPSAEQWKIPTWHANLFPTTFLRQCCHNEIRPILQ